MNEIYQAPFEADSMYRICARSNNQEVLFRSDENRRYFLLKFDRCLSELLIVYAYCLMDNHVHFLIRIKPFATITSCAPMLVNGTVNDVVSEAFRRFFIGYSMAFNKQYARTGNLFQRPFRRMLVDSDTYFTAVIAYIHCNPYKHLQQDYRAWKWSSYRRMLTEEITKMPRTEILEWFGGLSALVRFHEGYKEEFLDKSLWMED